MATDTLLKHGEIKHIFELLEEGPSAAGQSVRVLGKLLSFDVDRSVLTIEYKASRMDVDISLIADLEPQQGSLYQFIGEIASTQPLMLAARVGRNIDGMDTDLYDQALAARRQFEASLPWVSASGDDGEAASGGADAGGATAMDS